MDELLLLLPRRPYSPPMLDRKSSADAVDVGDGGKENSLTKIDWGLTDGDGSEGFLDRRFSKTV